MAAFMALSSLLVSVMLPAGPQQAKPQEGTTITPN